MENTTRGELREKTSKFATELGYDIEEIYDFILGIYEYGYELGRLKGIDEGLGLGRQEGYERGYDDGYTSTDDGGLL